MALSIQWHITRRCQLRCRHCYLRDRTLSEPEPTLSVLLRQLDSLSAFEKRCRIAIDGLAIGGGDPLLHADGFPFLQELRARGKTVYLMSNADTLTESSLERLGELGIGKVQPNLDGRENIHGRIRAPGSFRRTARALEALHIVTASLHR